MIMPISKGDKLSLVHRNKISEGLKGHFVSEETKEKIRQAHLGKKLSKEHIRKIVEVRIKNNSYIPWNKGKKLGFIPKMAFKKGNKKSENAYKFPIGSNHPNWKDGISKNKKYRSWIKNKRNRLKRSNGGSHTFGEWKALKAQYNWTCPVCGKSEPEIILTEDHIIPISRGGLDDIENLQPLCQSCNSKKNNKIIK